MPGTLDQNDWIARVLGLTVNVLSQDAPTDLRRWAAVKDIWFQAASAVDRQLAALEAVLRDSDDPEYQEIAEIGLGAVTGDFRKPLLESMRAIDKAGGQPEAGVVRTLRQVIADFIEHLAGDPHVDAVDDNDLGVPVDVAGTLIPALERLDTAVAAWARS